MKLYHATTKACLDSILARGLLVSYAHANGKIQGVWLHAPSRSAWAVLHTQRRHNVPLENVVVLEIHIARSKLKRFQRGLWYVLADIPRSAIHRAFEGIQYANSAK
jgi:hypothetical protein